MKMYRLAKVAPVVSSMPQKPIQAVEILRYNPAFSGSAASMFLVPEHLSTREHSSVHMQQDSG
jgi:hypothetical protein